MAGLVGALAKSTLQEVGAAVDEVVSRALAALGGRPARLALLCATVEHDASAVHAAVRARLGDVPISGITTSLGVLGTDGVTSGPGGALGLLLLSADSDVSFAVGHAPIGASRGEAGREAGREAARALLERLGQTPSAIVFHASPGCEEDVLLGVADVLPGVAVFGGSAADNAIVGEWWVFANDGVHKAAVTLAGVAGAVRAGGAMIAPYEVSGEGVEVTAGEGRHLTSLGREPAGVVLDRWLGGALEMQLQEGGNILGQTALRPVGLRRKAGEREHLVTIHPAQVVASDKSIELFARVSPGDLLCPAQGTEQGLIEALDELASRALAASSLAPDEVAAGVLIYCAGCSAAVGDRLDRGLREVLSRRLGGAPLLGMCTFGEQGHVPGLGNVHQNLSLSLLLLGR